MLIGTVFQDSPEWSLASRNVIGLRASPGSLLEMHSLRSQFRLPIGLLTRFPGDSSTHSLRSASIGRIGSGGVRIGGGKPKFGPCVVQ